MTIKNNLLFLVTSMTQFNELSKLASFINNHTEKNAIIFIYVGNQDLKLRIIKICQDLKLQYICFEEIQLYANKNIFFRFWSRIKYEIPMLFSLFVPKKEIRQYQYTKTIQENTAKAIIQQIKPICLFVAEDGIGGQYYLLKEFKHNKIPTINYPYEYSTSKQLENMVLADTDNYQLKSTITKFFFSLFAKKYLKEINNNFYIIKKKNDVFLAVFFGEEIPNPWTVHGGISDFLIAESDFMKRHYENEKIDKNKIMLLGSISDDLLFQNMQNSMAIKTRVFAEFGLDINKKTILCAFIPDYTHYPDCEFNNYEDLIDFLVNSLAKLEKFNVIYQLHPMILGEHKKIIEGKKIPISKEAITTLLPICDIYLTSVSSTIRYAISCAKPVINYDVYHANYPDYDSNDAVITVQTKEDYLDILNQLANNDSFYVEKISLQQQQAKIWGKMDGNCGNRIIEFLENNIY